MSGFVSHDEDFWGSVGHKEDSWLLFVTKRGSEDGYEQALSPDVQTTGSGSEIAGN